ncbi:hypothetical protein SUGI_0911510 [Cryptomeria japonica]|uniref:pleiotropic drug resistance protein 2 n=1 Tax=Cryptomeria japonica TaxID=3369 RepID=UPI002414A167|nr:pleiotropic drug resistance protein 2 [Cryptomeria japonica]GLJ43783.1 hypothetical protein SUGI_0911510 [Cryptomeria japonica]
MARTMGVGDPWAGDKRSSSRAWRSASTGLWTGDDVFSRSSTLRREQDDEEALKWAALEKLPTYDRLRKAILKQVMDNGNVVHEEVDVTRLGINDRHQLIEKILRVTEEDNERFLLKLRDRIDRVGIDLPKIEVRFEHLTVDADVYVGGRALPTLLNFTINTLEGMLSNLHLAPTKKQVLNILHDVSGVIKPSRMTLLLGPPSSGKTTLLLALAGKLDPDLKVSGRVTYNGHELAEFVPQRTSAYISQHDIHNGEMTVRETLDFSGRCQGVGTRYDMLTELSRREKEAGIKPDHDIDVFMKATAMEGQETNLVTDYVLKILGLDICADILVGDEMRRGISGGQKKRVTTGEMLVGPAKALFMDEISTGLDSSTTYQIVKCLRQSVHVMDGTMVISLLQPAPETYELFDDIILLSEGQIVYQGPRESVLEFFEFMGFKCPSRKGVADFLQEVTSRKDQAQYWTNRNQPYRYVPVNEFAESYNSFHVGQQLADELAVPFDKTRSHPAALVTEKYGLTNKELFKACFSREWLLMKRNSFVYVFKTTQISIMAFITMTVFLRTEMHHKTIADGNLYLGALFFGLVNVMFNGMAEMAMTIVRLPVFYKQRDLLFYPAWAFSLPIWVLRIPLSFLESGIWIVLTYYVVGFAPSASRFFRQFLALFWAHQMSLSLFRFISSVGRTMVISNTFGSFALLVVFVLGGFVISKDSVPNWWIWGYWTSPMMYGQNAIAINEYLDDRWNRPNTDSTIDEPTIGKAVLKSRGMFTQGSFYWIAIAALVAFSVLFNILFTLALEYLNPIGKPQATISEEALEEKHANRTGEELSSRGRTKSKTSGLSSHSLGASAEGIDMAVRRSSISSGGHSDRIEANIDASGVAPKRGMVLPFQPLSLAFDHVNYYVDMPAEMKNQGIPEDRLQLLRNVSGAFRPGVLTALVGVSGAGKTTLMDVLAGRKTGGYIEGTITISGYPKRQETFARVAGYCEQNDIHSPFVTVHESLIYSAWLRLPGEVDAETWNMFVEEVMELVELSPLRHALVGLPGVDGLSTEQRKRLTIAVELVANPSIIFMDEPTSGLDARAAAIVMRTVRNTVDTGRTVVCTIHQPSIDIFEAFDELLLMKRGGQVIYAGSLGRQSHKLVEYFEAIPGVSKITEGYNPATWMLEVSSPSAEVQLGIDFAEVYAGSSLYQRNQALIKELNTPAPGSMDLHFSTQYSQTFFVQCIACLWKQHWSYWRNPPYNVVRIFFTIVSALMFGSIFWKLGRKTQKQQDVNNILGALYAATIFLGVSNSSSVQPIVAVERTVFYREKAAGMYSAIPYAIAQVAIEIPYVMAQTVLYCLIVYSMVDFFWTAAKFFWFMFFMFMCLLYFTLYGMMTVALTPGAQFASIVSSFFYGFWNIFSGFLISRPQIPVWWRWYYWANPIAWTLYGLIVSQLGDLTTPVIVPGDSVQKSLKQYLDDSFGFKHDFLGVVATVHIGIVVMFIAVFAFGIKYLNFQRR